jgi:hypothetical protein
MIFKYLKPIYALSLLFFLTSNPFWANHEVDSSKVKISLFSHLVEQQYQEVTLKADLQLLRRKRYGPLRKMQKAKIVFRKADGALMKMNLKVESRGVYRKQFCDFPPIKLDFSKKRLRKKGFIGKFDKYKLVTHCMDNGDSDQTLLKEYAVYKMYNKLTPNSFRVHLIKITYQDIKDSSIQMEQYAFIIEENDEMAARLGGKKIKRYGTSLKKITKQSFYNSMVFNYMIGNLDWNVKQQKNVKFVKISKKKLFVVVPYDFDMCGFVEPEYAVLNADFGQQHLEERFCIGKFKDERTMIQTVNKFKQIKNDFISCYSDIDWLKKKQKREMTRYLDSFYEFLDDEAAVVDAFLEGKYSH